jgi:hypothetical protein
MLPTGWKKVWGVVCLACGLAAVVGFAEAATAQPSPTSGTNTVDSDTSVALAGLDERLTFAASSPRATVNSLRRAALQFVAERIKARRDRQQAASLPGVSNADPEAERRQRVEEERFERRLRRAAVRRAEARAQELHRTAPLPPERDPQGLTRPRPRAFLPSATGAISGNVSGPSGPLSVFLYLYDASGYYWSGTSSDPVSGNYSFTGLPGGTYYVATLNFDGFIDEAYDNVPCPSYSTDAKACGGSPIAVTDGVTTTGISFVLALGGRIAGTVTASASSSPITDVYVYVYDNSETLVGYGYTDSAGDYTTYQGLPSGMYFARTFQAGIQGYLDEAYDNIRCVPSCTITAATPISVTSPATTPDIDFALDMGGTISGTVTAEATGLPVSGVYVDVYSSTDGGYSYVGSSLTEADGTYTVGGLLTGDYFARTWNYVGYIDELYDDIPCASYCSIASGDLIAVTEGATTPGIDFALALGGSISGKITDSNTGLDIAGVPVDIFDSEGASVSYGYTDAVGNYTAGGLATGDYYAATSASSWAGLNYVDELYDDLPCVGGAYYGCYPTELGTSISVTEGATTSGIDFALSPGGAISGSLTNATTALPIDGSVVAFDRAGSGVMETWGSASYALVGLPGGTYYVGVEGFSGEIGELYDDIPCVGWRCDARRGDPVAVVTGATTSGIDFALSPGARISGKVTRADTGAPLEWVDVAIYNEGGSYVGYGYTDASGQYATWTGVPSGTYFAFTYAYSSGTDSLAGQLYQGIDCLSPSVDCTITSGDELKLTAPNTLAGVDFALRGGGGISGTVTDTATGLGIAGLAVYARVLTGSGRSTSRGALTAGNGAYTISGLPAGRYYVLTSNDLGYMDEVYNDLPCLGWSCDVSGGQQVEVTGGATTLGIDFALAEGGAISGTVTSSSSGLGLSASIQVYDSTGAGAVSSSSTAPGTGTYEIRGLPTGTYYLMADAGSGYVDELYNDVPCPNSSCAPLSGTGVSVTAGSTTSGIDLALSSSGAISGFVTDTGGLGAASGQVSLYRSSGDLAGTGQILVNGYYQIRGLSAENYYVVAFGDAGLIPEVYDDVPCLGCNPVTSGMPVPVSAGAMTSGIDFTLGQGARISGTVTGASGTPVSSAIVEVFDSSGNPVVSTYTDGEGVYLTDRVGLPAGDYYATASAPGLDAQLYSGLPCGPTCDPTSGTPITLTGSDMVTGVDFNLVGESLDFYTLDPCRLLDTRDATGLLGGPALASKTDRYFPVAGVCGVPLGAKSLSVNLAVTQPSTKGNLRLHPGRSRIPSTSTLNYTAGLTLGNNAVIPVNAVGELAVYCAQGSGTAHVIIDVNGYFK